MCLLIYLLESLDTRMGVDLRRRDRCVAEQLLHRAEIRARVEQMRRESMAQRVSGQAGVFVDLVQESLHGILDGAHRDAFAAAAEEECRSISRRSDRTQQLVTLRFVVPQRQLGVVADRNDALLSSLPAHLHLLRKQVDIRPTNAAQLRQSHPRGIEKLQYCAVPDVGEFSFLRLQLCRLKEQLYLRPVEIA